MASGNYFEEKDMGYDDFIAALDELDDGGVTIGVHAKDNDPADDDGDIGLAGLLAVHMAILLRQTVYRKYWTGPCPICGCTNSWAPKSKGWSGPDLGINRSWSRCRR